MATRARSLHLTTVLGPDVLALRSLAGTEHLSEPFRSDHRYRAVVRPWLWSLADTTDSRIHQDVTVVDVFRAVVGRHGLDAYDLRLTGSYRRRDCCVQYEESDLTFVRRLLEEEGIYFFFEHTPSKHLMVLADGPGAHTAARGYEQVAFRPGGATASDGIWRTAPLRSRATTVEPVPTVWRPVEGSRSPATRTPPSTSRTSSPPPTSR